MHEQLLTILQSITALTNLVGANIRPITAQINTDAVNHATFTISEQEGPMNLDGPGTDKLFNLEVTVYCPDHEALGVATSAVKQTLNGYRDSDESGGNFQLVWFTGETESTDQDETTFRTMNFSTWAL